MQIVKTVLHKKITEKKDININLLARNKFVRVRITTLTTKIYYTSQFGIVRNLI